MLTALLLLLWSGATHAGEVRDEFDAPSLPGWQTGSRWGVVGGTLQPPVACADPCLLLSVETARHVLMRVDVRLPEEGRRNPALVFRARPDGTRYVLRWYDRMGWLELIRYERGRVVRVDGNHWLAASPRGSVPQQPGQWYRMRIEIMGELVRAKVWPRGEEEPDWQLQAACPDTSPGAYGLGADQSVPKFDTFVARAGDDVQQSRLAEAERAAGVLTRRGEVTLEPGALLQYGSVSATFRLSADDVGERAPELLFRVRDSDNYLFARADSRGLVLGRVIDAEESVLAAIKGEWADGPGEYLVDVSVAEATADERGAAWFVNRLAVPPVLHLKASVGRADGLRPALSSAARVDPVAAGNSGEPYWLPNPFTASSARVLLGSGLGWRTAPGVEWLGLETRPRLLEEQSSRSVEPLLRIRTDDRGGCWLVLGDLDHDQRLDYLVARNDEQAVTALTAYANDGSELWRWGDGGSPQIAYDLPATVYDIDRDGRAEVLCGVRGQLLVLDGATGREEARWTLPPGLEVADTVIIANLRGLGAPSDILVKTRYDDLWAFTNAWLGLWEYHGNTGHHPDVRDVDADGRDEVLAGFTLLDDDGSVLWRQDLPEHADAARLVAVEPGGPVRALKTCCGGLDMALSALDGGLLWRQRPQVSDFHFQTTHVGEVRPDIPGHEIVVDEGWARPGRARLALLSARGDWLGTFYASYPRFHRVIDWDGDGVLEVALPSDGVLCDGRGRTVVRLAGAPRLGAAGAESPMARVADVAGDGRDELVLYNAREIVVYANPEPARRPFEPKPVVMKRYYNATYY